VFGFTKVDRETYNSTFLRKVIINVKFPFTNQLKEKSKDIIDLFKVDFPRAVLGKNKGFQISIEGKEGQPNFRTIDEDDNISLKTELTLAHKIFVPTCPLISPPGLAAV